MFDAHCHLDLCHENPQEVLLRARNAGVRDLLIAGVQADGWGAQNALAGTGVHVAWGIHPWRIAAAPQAWEQEWAALESILEKPPTAVVALGETGLDYGRRIDPGSHALQKEAFRKQLQLAKHYDLPVVLHIVRAHQDAIKILKEEGVPQAGGLVHSFGGNDVQAKQYVDLNLHISFSGSVVNPKRTRVRNAATTVPNNRILVETDSPDQTPETRKPLPNEPAFLLDVIATIAQLRGCSATRLAKTTSDNAHALLGTHPS